MARRCVSDTDLELYSVQIIENIIRDVNNNGTKIIAVTHDLLQARRLASDIIFFHKGDIRENTKAKDFFRKPESREARYFIEGKIVI